LLILRFRDFEISFGITPGEISKSSNQQSKNI